MLHTYSGENRRFLSKASWSSRNERFISINSSSKIALAMRHKFAFLVASSSSDEDWSRIITCCQQTFLFLEDLFVLLLVQSRTFKLKMSKLLSFVANGLTFIILRLFSCLLHLFLMNCFLGFWFFLSMVWNFLDMMDIPSDYSSSDSSASFDDSSTL